MSKLTKNQKIVADKIEAGKAYTLDEAVNVLKEITFTKFDASVDIDMRLGVDPRKANQMVQVSKYVCSVCVLPTRRQQRQRQVRTT